MKRKDIWNAVEVKLPHQKEAKQKSILQPQCLFS